jgi:signal transduction histidine kinase
MTAQDREARLIARELHDSVGQYLAAIQMNLSVLGRTAVSEQNKKLSKRLPNDRRKLHNRNQDHFFFAAPTVA